MFFTGNYLRVLSPVTSNGTNPKIGDDGRVQYKEALLPLTAKKALESQNNKLPEHLRKKIEVVNSTMETIEAENTGGELARRGKPGPKPKVKN